MSNSKTEIGISIVHVKSNGTYYQATDEYTFYPAIHSASRCRISWLSISEQDALSVIESQQLTKRDSDESIRWVCKRQLKADSYAEKTRKYFQRLMIEDGIKRLKSNGEL